MSSWAEKRLGDLIDGLEAGVSVRSRDGDVTRPAVLKTSAISDGTVDFAEVKAIVSDDLHRAKCSPSSGSIIISRMNTPNLVGAVGYVELDEPGVFLPDRLWLARARNPDLTDMRWLNYRLGFGEVAARVRELATGTSNSMKNIPKGRLLELKLLVPEIAEQGAIAAALLAADNLIASIDSLIEKKRDIKQGLMQELLSGRTRLPGFSGAWGDLASLDDMCTRSTGFWGVGVPSSSAPHRVRVITAGDITPLGRISGASERYFTNSQLTKARCRKDDVVITSSGNGLGKTAYIEEPGRLVASNFVRILRPRAGVSGAFLAQVMWTPSARAMLDSNTATSAYPNLLPAFFSEKWLPNPPLEEQRAIATVLTDADTEIEGLERRLESTRAIKRGMMQELLTGRTRLVPEVAA